MGIILKRANLIAPRERSATCSGIVAKLPAREGTMPRPETKYARSGDVRIAYQVTGTGPVDMVLAPGTASHLDLAWDWPPTARFIERLSSFCRLIRFDKRGTGMSDRPTAAATLEERTDDIRAVMDAAGSEKGSIFGVSEGGSMACLFAATYPSRTTSLLLWGVQARWTKTADYPWGDSAEEYQRMIDGLAENGVTLSYAMGSGAGIPKDSDPTYREWFVRYLRAGASPSAMVALERMNSQIDIRDILPTIRVPTLVMNRTGDPVAKVGAARDLAAHIPGAKFLEFPGETHQFHGIADQVLAEIEQFVTGTRSHPISDRVLATILFVDVVGSTSRLVRIGDARWRDLLAKFQDISRRAFAAFQGREVRSTGDGFLATFDGPTRAIQCAREVRDSARPLGLKVRSGLHTGECELMGNDVTGAAVHLAARIAAAAGPGQIVVSSTVRDLVTGSALRFEDRGPSVLKGFSGERRLFTVA